MSNNSKYLARLRARLRARAADSAPQHLQAQDDGEGDMADGRLSWDRERRPRPQGQRSARMVRIDHESGDDALAIIEAKRGKEYPLKTNSGGIDAILTDCPDRTRVNYQEVKTSKSPKLADRNARAQEFGGLSGTIHPSSCARAGAYEFGRLTRHKAQQERRQATRRVVCGARRHRDGQPCQAKSEPGKLRCRFHGGRSTGPRTPEGKIRSLANLRQYARNVTE